jgi:hypothetical protein
MKRTKNEKSLMQIASPISRCFAMNKTTAANDTKEEN